MNEKITSSIQRAQQERKRGQFDRAIKRLEQTIASFPDELELYLEAVDACIEGGELMQATNFLKSAQDKFAREKDRVTQFVREKLQTVHDPSLARGVVEHAVKRRDLEIALALLDEVPDHTVRDLLNRAKNKNQSLKSASHGGYTLRGEMITNELTNALLSIRIGNLKEATATMVKILEDKPLEHKSMDPCLAALESKHPKSGRIRFARGCALRAAANEVDAIHRFVEAARLEPACAAGSIEQLRAMKEHAHHPGKVQRALAETILLKGDLDEAATTLREYIGDNPENAREVIMLVRPFIDATHGVNACTWLALETALSIEQSSVALEILRPIHQRGGHGPELYDWLEAKAKDGFLPADVMMFLGSLAIEQKQYERAAEILGAVCSTSPQDTQAVLSIIDRHRSADPSLEALYQKHATVEAAEAESGSAADEGEFTMFENKSFRLEGAEGPGATSAPGKDAGTPKPQFSKASPFSRPAEATGSPEKRTLPKKSFVDARELSLDEDLGTDTDTDSAAGEDSITESHVTNVAQGLHEAGAAAFFHIDGADAATTDAEPAPAATTGAPAATTGAPAATTRAFAPAPAAAPATSPAASELPTFASEYQRFVRGELDNTAVLALLERAAQDAHVDELQELLHFQPETGLEHFARYYYQAEYHALRNQPLQALEILARLDTPDMDDEQRPRVWLRIAICQRMIHNYAGASETLDRLIQRFPDRPEYARLKRRNQEQFLSEQSLEAHVLEKTSALD